jgi:hypothetical protein
MALLVNEAFVKDFIGETADLDGVTGKPTIILKPENSGSSFYDRVGKQFFMWYDTDWGLM